MLEDSFGREIRRFRSQKVKAMLAYLALHLGSACPREVLYEALWPEEEHQIVANRFRVALASLRRQLEPEGTPFGSVLDVSEPGMVRLRSEAVSCDVFQFEALWRAGRRAEALPLAQEPLLPGNYEEWAISVRLHYELLMQDLSPSEEESSKPSAPHPATSTENPISAPHPEPRVHSLPLFLTRFFGREREKRQLHDLIRENRLVTVTGIGGIGKTRLATETARERMQECFFVALGPVADPARLDEAVLKSLGVASGAALLPEEVRAFFFALALFQDGWTIEMAQTMTGCEWCEEFLQLLAAASLVERREDERLGVIRFSFRETVRQFALQHSLNKEPLPEWDSADNLIVNGSFERDRPNPSWLTVSGGMFAYPFIVPSGWQGVGSVNVNTPSYAAFPSGIPDGANTAAVGDQTRSGRLFQDVSAQLTAGTAYTLSAWVGNRTNYTGSGRVRLETTSGHLLADSGIVTPAEGAFQKVTLTFTTQSDTVGLGEGLRVVLERADGTQANFDGVRLTTSSAEPEAAGNRA